MLYDGAARLDRRRTSGLLDRTILLDGFSKTFAMTGWRLGYAARARRRWSSRSRGCSSTPSRARRRPSQLAGVAALTGPHGRRCDAMIDRVPRAAATLVVAGLNDAARRLVRRAAGRVLRLPEHHRDRPRRRASSQTGCSTRPASRCWPAPRSAQYGEGYLRLSYANSLENIADRARRRCGELLERVRRLMVAGSSSRAGSPSRRSSCCARPATSWVSPHDRPLDARRAARGGRRRRRGRDAAARPRRRRAARRRRAGAAGRRQRRRRLRQRRRRGVRRRAACVVTNTPGVLTDATADIALALILMATRRLGEGERLIRAGAPWAWSMFFMLGTGSQGKTLGHRRPRADRRGDGPPGPRVRHGRSSTRAPRAPTRRRGRARRAACSTSTSCSATSDVVSLHCPLTAETRHLIDARRLRAMKPTAYLVNTARGPGRRRGGAGRGAARRRRSPAPALDVFEQRARGASRPARARERRARPAPRLGHHRDADGDGDAGRARTRSRCCDGADPPTPVN